MLSLLSTLQLSAPWFLAFGLLTPLLIYAFLKRSDVRKRTVSSLVVLRTLTKRETVRQRFKPPLRFFLELLALLAVCLAGALPTLLDERNTVAIVFDNSLSMRALQVNGTKLESRFEEAQAAAKKWIDEQRSDASFTVFASAPKLIRLGEEGVGKSDARRMIGEMKASWTSDTLDSSVEELSANGSYDRVLVVTDKTFEASEAKASEGLFRDDRGGMKTTRISALSVGKPKPNVAVSRLSFSASSLADSGPRLRAAISLSSATGEEVVVSFSAVSPDGGDRSLGHQTLRLNPEQTRETEVELPADVDPAAVFRVSVSLADEQRRVDGNALLEDDTAWLGPRAAGSGKQLLLVSPRAGSAGSVFGSAPSLGVVEITPEQYAAMGERELSGYSTIVFHRSAPSRVPPVPTLLVLPPEGNPFFPVRSEASASRVTSWSPEHPITSYLKVPLLDPGNAEVFDVPLWAQSIIRVDSGAVVVAGESHGIRFAAVGIELLPFEGTKTPVLSVLTLNLLSWLSGGSELTGSTLAGSALKLEEGKRWTVRTPQGTKSEIRAEQGAPPSYVFASPGLYRLETTGDHKEIAVNSFFPEESATFVQGVFHSPAEVEHHHVRLEGARPLWPPLLFLALALLALELILAAIPRRRTA